MCADDDAKILLCFWSPALDRDRPVRQVTGPSIDLPRDCVGIHDLDAAASGDGDAQCDVLFLVVRDGAEKRNHVKPRVEFDVELATSSVAVDCDDVPDAAQRPAVLQDGSGDAVVTR